MLNIGMFSTIGGITVVLSIGMISIAVVTTSMWSHRYVLIIDMISIVVLIICMLNIDLASINTCVLSVSCSMQWPCCKCRLKHRGAYLCASQAREIGSPEAILSTFSIEIHDRFVCCRSSAAGACSPSVVSK